jgi:hypothetical protein
VFRRETWSGADWRSCGLGVAVVSGFAGVTVVAGGSGVAVVAGGFLCRGDDLEDL